MAKHSYMPGTNETDHAWLHKQNIPGTSEGDHAHVSSTILTW